MSDAKLKTRIKRLHKALLEPRGFVLARARIPERKLVGLRQGIEFQPGSGHLGGRYTLNVYWSFLHPLDEGISMDASKRIGELAGRQDNWFSREGAQTDVDFQIVEDLVERIVLPYFERFDTAAKIVNAHAAGELSDTQAFGADPGWRNYNLGFCHALIGNADSAMHHFNEVVAKHSADPYAWVRIRQVSASEHIQRLRADPDTYQK